MKILRIGGKNLASLADEFSVDFTQQPLATSGLFAISGPTGAGKSTLLDALCLALYDDTPRLLKASGKTPDTGDHISSQDPRTLLRRGAPEGHAEVDFVGNDGQSYRARWNVRRARTKAAGALQPTSMSLHKLPELQPIGNTKTEVRAEIEQRIGLSFDQFTRAVLLAQNEFSTFLKAGDDERGALLETLTGSVAYSDISRRAHERAKQEQQVLQNKLARLADQKPFSADQRADIETQCATADTALAAIDQRKLRLEADLRWHQQSERMAQGVAQAAQAVQERQADAEAAAPRRAALAQLEAVQGARPLHDDLARIDADRNAMAAALPQAAQAAQDAAARSDALAQAQQQALAALAAAEAAQAAAAPLLDQAKALDARLDTLASAERTAGAKRDSTKQAAADAHAAASAKADQQTRLAHEQEIGQAWLDHHRPWGALAQEWPRWDVLFTQAGQEAARAVRHADALATAQASASRHQHDEAAAREGLQAAAERLHSAEAQRTQASAALAAIDAEALLAHRGTLELRREQLQAAEKALQEIEARQQREQALATSIAKVQQSRSDAEQQVASSQRRNLELVAASSQAEKSLAVAEAACGESVEKLRATLQDGTPCPVCGAEEHPYQHQDTALQSMLATLRAQVSECRAELQKNMALEAAQRATEQSCIEQLANLTGEQHALAAGLALLHPQWLQAASALAAPGSPPADGHAEWLAAQSAALQTALREAETQETALRRASATRDVAQKACDQAAADHARLLAAQQSAHAALAQVRTQLEGLEEQRTQTALQLAGLLDQLDAAFNSHDAPHEGWQEEWKAGPARFHELRAGESKQWLAQRSACDERAAAIKAVSIELQALQAAHARAAEEAQSAASAHATALAALQEAQTQRQALWEGRATAEVEAALRAAIDAARSALAARQEEHQQAAQQRARAEEALAHQQQRQSALATSSAAALAKLEAWLAEFQAANPAHAEVATLGALRTLLAQPAEQLRAEREALQALENATATARTVLAERESQLAAHKEAPPQDAGADAAALQAALEQASAERQQALDHATALKLQLAQDDARRQASASMLADIEQQEEIERRWARLNELIGSADGKKFRNYAQQFTLDVLLGYANAHLAQLAPRYQLERLNNPAQPALGLLIRDLHMGDELRSVHSLSGGESFLASLALALGLASLSSNRVKVESLFIDEGFGSLDADTLRVAMDALDGLQSMGRKVGVISHVQEMTERIATRILVQPAAGGRSVVSVG